MKRNFNQESAYGRTGNENGWSEQNVPEGQTIRENGETLRPRQRRAYSSHQMLKGAAGRAANSEEDGSLEADSLQRQSEGYDRTEADTILGAHEQQRPATDAAVQTAVAGDATVVGSKDSEGQIYSTGNSELIPDDSAAGMRQKEARPKGSSAGQRRKKQGADTSIPASAKGAGNARPRKGKKKKKQPNYGISISDMLKQFIPWRGDSGSEKIRKLIFTTALTIVGVCTFKIGSYYLDLYQAKAEYERLQARIEEARANRHFNESETVDEPMQVGTAIEYLEYNEIADTLLPLNPDLVGFIRIEKTNVSYPVVQKKSSDINKNTNDYYLYRTFRQEQSRSGCIFMDYRCHFDEVADHRRTVKNSDNLLIYGHNMNNRSMFGCLRDYVNNPYFYKEHPIVELQSLYKSYEYKIFAVLIVDGVDFDSEYAFDCWNTLDFEGETDFYEFVNNAKKRTLITNDVDVKYGDPILTLYTCNGLHANAKLILMCRLMRAGEDRLEGTENAALNDNVLYTAAYYKAGHKMTYDPEKFIPYGPEA